MGRPPVMQRFLPVRGSTTSDSQFSAGAETAESDNLAAIIKNNLVLFDTPILLARQTADTPSEKKADPA